MLVCTKDFWLYSPCPSGAILSSGILCETVFYYTDTSTSEHVSFCLCNSITKCLYTNIIQTQRMTATATNVAFGCFKAHHLTNKSPHVTLPLTGLEAFPLLLIVFLLFSGAKQTASLPETYPFKAPWLLLCKYLV